MSARSIIHAGFLHRIGRTFPELANDFRAAAKAHLRVLWVIDEFLTAADDPRAGWIAVANRNRFSGFKISKSTGIDFCDLSVPRRCPRSPNSRRPPSPSISIFWIQTSIGVWPNSSLFAGSAGSSDNCRETEAWNRRRNEASSQALQGALM